MPEPAPIFTDRPRQHPNLIIGALHLLAWMIFHPTAFRNYLQTLDRELKPDSSWLFFLRNGRWRQGKNIRFFLQSQIILPILAVVMISCGNLLMGVPFNLVVENVIRNIEYVVTISLASAVTLSFAFGVMVSIAGVVAFSLGLCVVWCLGVSVAFGVVFCVISGMAVGVIFGISFGVTRSLMLGMAFGVTTSFMLSVVGSMSVGLGIVAASSVLFDVALGVASVVASVVGGIVGYTIHTWLPYIIYPLIQSLNGFLYRLDRLPHKRQRIFLRWHSVGWYEGEHLPLMGLDQHLILATEIDWVLGTEAINYVSTTKQQWAAQSAQIELDARMLAQCQTIEAISQLHTLWGYTKLESHTSKAKPNKDMKEHAKILGVKIEAYVTSILYDNKLDLSNPAVDIFRIFNRIVEDIRAAREQQSKYNQRLALTAIIRRIDGYLLEFNRSINKYTPRFRPILVQWQQIIAEYIESQRQATELDREIESPYIIGIPLTNNQQIFIGRQDLGRRLEQLILDVRRPPLLLYGQRRMGKTSLLNNLNRLLPSTIIPLFVDLQGNAAAANNLAGLLYALARDLRTTASQREIVLPPVQLADFQAEPIIQFNDWLDTLETSLGENIALLALDEFEALDTAFQRQRLDPDDVLGLLRRTIQHRPKFKVLIAGSHTLAEYQKWSSYLINVQTLHVSYLKQSEARQLIEHPIPDFSLQYTPNALELVLHLTRCHPYLVQLLCAEIVALKNEQDSSERGLATSEDVETAVPLALSVGSVGFFGDIQTNQVDALGREILIYLAQQGDGTIVSHAQLTQQFSTDITPSLQILLQRELLEPVNNGYRFAIELIRRWFLKI